MPKPEPRANIAPGSLTERIHGSKEGLENIVSFEKRDQDV